jgi:hypothetical protein
MKGSFLSPRGGGTIHKSHSSDEPENQGKLLTNATESDFSESTYFIRKAAFPGHFHQFPQISRGEANSED